MKRYKLREKRCVVGLTSIGPCSHTLASFSELVKGACSTTTLSIYHPCSTTLLYICDPLIMPATTAETLSLVTRNVSVAPLVLLSVADHYGRSAKGTRRRVVGVLLGQNDGKNVRVSNSFAGKICDASIKSRTMVLMYCPSSTFRGRRKGPISMVHRSQLYRVYERHV